MKKIFFVEINEKDKNINNEEIINELEQHFEEFSKNISNNKDIYIRFKRVGSTWQNILDNLNKIKYNNKKNKKNDNKTNHLKVIK